MKHTAFFGDGEHVFSLPIPQLEELQRVTGAGIGGLYSRLCRVQFAYGDIAETIRLGLIGGGMSPKDAAALVTAYVHPRPLAETLPIALAIIETAWFGEPSKDAANG